MIRPLRKLQTDPLKYTNEKIKHYDRMWLLYRLLYLIISILVSLFAIFAALLTAYIVFITPHGKPKPDSYFYIETGISAIITMFGTIINFFYIRNKYIDAGRRKHKIHTEIILFQNEIDEYGKDNKNRVYDFYINITKICKTYSQNTKTKKKGGK